MDKLINRFFDLGKRFQGVDIQYRRFGSGWDKQWRASCFSNKSFGRAVVYGDSLEESMEKLIKIIDELST